MKKLVLGILLIFFPMTVFSTETIVAKSEGIMVDNSEKLNENYIGWIQFENTWYYNDSGVMQTGWLKVDNKWYYMNSNGMMQTGWQKINGKWYYMNSSGVMQTGWRKITNKWYYLNSSGVMHTGEININGIWYYMNPQGALQAENKKVIPTIKNGIMIVNKNILYP